MIIEKAKYTHNIAYNNRKKQSKIDEQEIIDRIYECTQSGEMYLYYVRTKEDKYPIISKIFINSLKKAGYKVKLWYGDWDNNKEFYRGGLTIKWRKCQIIEILTRKNFGNLKLPRGGIAAWRLI